ncbi:glycosyltransferase family 2 protein [Nocardioides sp. Kera G14]|nr:glycosyltransferase family 2 protein [Nocardioides sp. Kera G14]
MPAHNEERLIRTVIDTAPELVDFILVIDDASTDRTAEIARTSDDPRLEVRTLARNLGVGGAIITGHRRAIELGADVSVVMAGDAQMDPNFLPALLDPIVDGTADFTKANRFYSPKSLKGMPRMRIFGSIALSFLTKAASGYWSLFDPQNGYTATSVAALTRLDLDSVSQRYDFENDFLINLNISGARARDIAVPAIYGDEISGMKLTKVAPRILRTLVGGFWRRIWWKYVLQSFSPVALLLFTGLLCFFFSFIAGTFVVVHTLGPPTASAGTVLLAVAPFLTGLHLTINALMLDIQEGNK